MTAYASELMLPLDIEQLIGSIRQVHHDRAKLSEAARLGRFGHWLWDPQRDEVTASDELCALYGAVPGELDGHLAGFLRRVHPADRTPTELALKTAAAEGRSFEHHHRLLWPDGGVRVVRIRGERSGGDPRRATSIFGVSADVTGDWTARAELQEALGVAKRTLDATSEGIVALDAAGRVAACNSRLPELIDLSGDVSAGTPEAWLVDRLDELRTSPVPLADARDGDLFTLRSGRVLERRRSPGPPGPADATEALVVREVPAPTPLPLRVWSFRDITERENARRRTACLAAFGRLQSLRDLEAALEALARAALPELGHLCAVDRICDGRATRLLEVRTLAEVWLEPPQELCAVERIEVRGEASRSRVTAPIAHQGKRLGLLSFVRAAIHAHGAEELELAQELADRVALLIENAEAHRQAAEALADREQLLYVVGHELRNPLASLRLSVDAMVRSDLSQAVVARQVAIIDRVERRLSRLVNELLDAGRIHSGQLELDLAPVDLREIVRDVINRMQPEITRSGSGVAVDGEAPVVGRWDRSRLDQVVTNLLSNALKFGEGRPVEVRLTAAEGRARLAVVDHGLGIPSELQPWIFEPFKRVAGLVRFEGLGLGLHIVRTIVQRMGGEIRVESQPGRGATFAVVLPIEPQGDGR